MLEVSRPDRAIIRCLAQPEAIENFETPGVSFGCRLAEDDLLLVSELSQRSVVLAAASTAFAARDPNGLTLDQTDGFTAIALAGDSTEEAFSRFSAIPLPDERPAFCQGIVAGIAAKVILRDGAIEMLVSSLLGHHFLDCVMADLSDLDFVKDAGERTLS